MRTYTRKAAELGEVIATAFDEAAQHTANPQMVSRMAALVVLRLWRRSEDSKSVKRPARN